MARAGDASRSSRIKPWQAVVLILVLLVGLVVGLVATIRFTIGIFADLQPEVAASIITVSGTVLVAAVTVALGRYAESRSASIRAQQEKRVQVYEQFLHGLLDMMGAFKPPEKRGQPDLTRIFEVFGGFTQQIILWGSGRLVRSWGKYKNADHTEGEATLYALEEFMLVMRKDLGLSNRGSNRVTYCAYLSQTSTGAATPNTRRQPPRLPSLLASGGGLSRNRDVP